MKYTFEDFKAKKIALQVDKQDRPEFNKACDAHGVTWHSGHKAGEWSVGNSLRAFCENCNGKVTFGSASDRHITVNFRDLLPVSPTFAVADFLAGKIGIRCDTREEYDRLMRECEKANVKWRGGDPIIDLNGERFKPGSTYTLGDTRAKGMLMKCRELHRPYSCAGCRSDDCGHKVNVPFSALFGAVKPAAPKYKVGDRFKVTEDRPHGSPLNRGEIVTLYRFATDVPTVRASDGCTWYLPFKYMEYMPGVAPNPFPRIEITADGPVTTAILYEDGKAVKIGTSKCNPEDEYDFVAGATLAFSRLKYGAVAHTVTLGTVRGICDKLEAITKEFKEAVK